MFPSPPWRDYTTSTVGMYRSAEFRFVFGFAVGIDNGRTFGLVSFSVQNGNTVSFDYIISEFVQYSRT